MHTYTYNQTEKERRRWRKNAKTGRAGQNEGWTDNRQTCFICSNAIGVSELFLHTFFVTARLGWWWFGHKATGASLHLIMVGEYLFDIPLCLVWLVPDFVNEMGVASWILVAVSKVVWQWVDMVDFPTFAHNTHLHRNGRQNCKDKREEN